jgi:hypothetical protein
MISTCRLHRGRCIRHYDTKLEGQKVKFQLNVKNLFDRTYYTSAASRFFVRWGCAAGEPVEYAGVLTAAPRRERSQARSAGGRLLWELDCWRSAASL